MTSFCVMNYDHLGNNLFYCCVPYFLLLYAVEENTEFLHNFISSNNYKVSLYLANNITRA